MTATGPGGTIAREDVEAAAAGSSAVAHAVSFAPAAGERETRIPDQGRPQGHGSGDGRLGVHRAARHRVGHRRRHPHHEDGRAARGRPRLPGLKVSPLLVVARAVCLAVRRTPRSTPPGTRLPRRSCSSTTSTSGSLLRRLEVCSCPTSRTPRTSTPSSLAEALGELTAVAREGKTPPADQAGGTFTITNVGVFGVDCGTPILNPGESGILAMGAIKRQPWVVGNKIKPRWVTTLALSFDHRVADGEQGSRFLADVASIVEDPGNTLLL